MPKTTRERDDTLIVRVESDLTEAVRQMAVGSEMSKSEMARELLRRGIRAVAEDENGPLRIAPPPTYDRPAAADRTRYLMEQLDVIAHGLGDPADAAKLLRGVSDVAAEGAKAWERLARRQKGQARRLVEQQQGG